MKEVDDDYKPKIRYKKVRIIKKWTLCNLWYDILYCIV